MPSDLLELTWREHGCLESQVSEMTPRDSDKMLVFHLSMVGFILTSVIVGESTAANEVRKELVQV